MSKLSEEVEKLLINVYKDFKWDGYNTDEGCEICGRKPAKIEPRFGYKSCAFHSRLTPLEFQEDLGFGGKT